MLKKLGSLAVCAVAGLMVVSSAYAGRDFATIYVECGLGALLAPKTPVVAVITNITWDLGTTAISSELSSPESCKGGQAKTASFINDSLDELEVDLARGSGAHLDMLATLVDYEIASVEQADFSNKLRAEFAKYVATTDYSTQNHFEKAQALYDMVYSLAG